MAKSVGQEGSIDIDDVVEETFEQGWNPSVRPVVVPISNDLSVVEKSIIA